VHDVAPERRIPAEPHQVKDRAIVLQQIRIKVSVGARRHTDRRCPFGAARRTRKVNVRVAASIRKPRHEEDVIPRADDAGIFVFRRTVGRQKEVAGRREPGGLG
jgi:hypothetical protein